MENTYILIRDVDYRKEFYTNTLKASSLGEAFIKLFKIETDSYLRSPDSKHLDDEEKTGIKHDVLETIDLIIEIKSDTNEILNHKIEQLEQNGTELYYNLKTEEAEYL